MSALKRNLNTRGRAKGPPATAGTSGNDKGNESPRHVGCLPPLRSPRLALNTESLTFKPAPQSVIELPRLVAEVGPQVATGESVWMQGSSPMASALGTDNPFKPTELQQVERDAPSLKPKEEEEETKAGKESKLKSRPLTSDEVVEILTKKRHLGEFQFYYLRPSSDDPYKPYDLHVVPRNKAGVDHFIFTPTSVVHVQGGSSTQLKLSSWQREAALWRALRGIPFFRDYLTRRAFTRWRKNLQWVTFQRTRATLDAQLLMAVPQFREALFHFSRLIEDLKRIHWLPQDDSKTYTLVDFQRALMIKNQESRGILERFLQYRSLILNLVQFNSYEVRQELQELMERSQPDQRSRRLHPQPGLLRGIQEELGRAESALQRLGNMAALVNHMAVQNLVTITHCELNSFLNRVLKRQQQNQANLFQAEVVFEANGHLTLLPPMHLFQDVLLGAVLSVADAVLQVLDSYSYSPDIKEFMSLSTTGLENKGTELSDGCSFLSSRNTQDSSPPKLVIPKRGTLRVQGQRLRGHYYPLPREQLAWQLSLNAGVQEVERELARITEEARAEVIQLCEELSWLVEAHSFASQWGPASLEGMRGWSSQKYEEHIQKMRLWTDKVLTVPSSFTTSNKLLTVQCSNIQELLVPLLNSIEQEVLKLLTEELQLRSETLVSELKRALAGLGAEPTDFSDFINYASLVERSERTYEDTQKQLEYLTSLRETIRRNCRCLTPEEVSLNEQMVDLWDRFAPSLKHAAEVVGQRLPIMAETLDQTFSSLAQELQDLVSSVNSGPYLDPTQNATQMHVDLKAICKQARSTAVQLNELSSTSKSLRGHTLDLTFLTVAIQSIEARKGLWKLMKVSTAQIQEWRALLFSKFSVSGAQETVNDWLQQALSLATTIPPHDALLHKIQQNLENFGQQLPVLANLSSPVLKHKHWRNIFKGMGLPCVSEWTSTVADLLSNKLLEHQTIIRKICYEAKVEADMEQAFRKLQKCWNREQFRLAKFFFTVWHQGSPQLAVTRLKKPPKARSPPTQYSRDSGTYTIIGLDAIRAQIEDSVMSLSSMLLSPFVAEFRQEAEQWVQLLQELEQLLHLCERYQQKWVFLSKMFHDASVSTPKVKLWEKFHPVDQTFREIIQTTSNDPYVLKIVRHGKSVEENGRFQGQNLRTVLIEGLTIMEDISNQLLYLLDSPRREFPRLCFLSDCEVIRLLSLHPTPSSLLPLVRKCFSGIQWLEAGTDGDVDHEPDMMHLRSKPDLSDTQMCVQGVYGTLREHVPFLSPVEPNLNPLIWLRQLEQHLQQSMKRLMSECSVNRQNSDTIGLEQESDNRAEVAPTCEPPHISSPSDYIKKDKGTTIINEPPGLLERISKYPLQCILVAEEVFWYKEVQKAAQNQGQVKLTQIQARNAAKLQSLCQEIHDNLTDSSNRSLASHRTLTALQALILMTVKHSQQLSELAEVTCDLECSFEWQKLMKYHFRESENLDQNSFCHIQEHLCKEPLINIDVLGARLSYSYEYIGPENWMMVHTPTTDRAILGILLALTSCRSSFISGPCMSGKRMTAVQVGRMLGRQVIILGCWEESSSAVVHRMLSGALQTGAWLVLDSVNSMSQGVLSILGQHLDDIHQSLSIIRRHMQQKEGEFQSDGLFNHTPSREDENILPKCFGDCDISDDRECSDDECQMCFAEKNSLAKLRYGCILISSNGYSVKLPENLRIATRPVSLALPDYKIIAEVMFLSSGFSEASPMSCRLLSLFSLAQDSLCLPDSVRGTQTSWFVLLRNVISASGIFLHSNSQFEGINKDKVLGEHGQRSLNTTFELTETMAGAINTHQSSRHRGPNQIINAVLEEQAVVKGVMAVLLPAIYEQNKASQFRAIFGEIFPTALSCTFPQQSVVQGEQNILRGAVIEEFQQTGFYADPGLLHRVLSLYQALKLLRAVVLIGPAGSGKTTCYKVLAGALRKLAMRVGESDLKEDPIKEGDAEETDPMSSTSNWTSVDTAVLFPNALPHKELFGGCYEPQGSWWDGAITKVLRESEEQHFSVNVPNKIRKVKWLVLDGNPLSQPGWLDPLSSFGNRDGSFICLSSGEKIWPSQDNLKILVETTDLGDATPSAVTSCSMVYLTGNDLWKAVWKVEMDALFSEHTLDQGTLKKWSRLAEDLFSSTIIFLRDKVFTSVISGGTYRGSESSSQTTYGLQEVMSFIRILHALLEQYWKDGTQASVKTFCAQSTTLSNAEEQTINLFVVAYIWGFGGHLHPRHWPQFDLFARHALYMSRYKVELPAEGTVFEHLFTLTDGLLGSTSNTVSCARRKSSQLSYTPVPQYERYTCLLDLLMDAHQPALLVGESGSGKTMLCQSRLTERPHLHLPASPRLSSSDLRSILENVGNRKTQMGKKSTIMKHLSFLLFVDDLHEAPFDACGKTSMVQETLRQCISMCGVQTSDLYHFKLFCSGAISYLCTCTTPEGRHNDSQRISTRLSRLFTILVLPTVSADVLFSIHSTQLQHWLEDVSSISSLKVTDMANCIVMATLDLYHAVLEKIPPITHRPHVFYSLHDLHKVFQGMFLWRPCLPANQLMQRKAVCSLQASCSSSALPVFDPANLRPAANVLNIARLWMHECLRTFGDRLSTDEDYNKLVSVLAQVSGDRFSGKLATAAEVIRADSPTSTSTFTATGDRKENQQHLSTQTQKDSDENMLSNEQHVKSPLLKELENVPKQVELANSPEKRSDCDTSSMAIRQEQNMKNIVIDFKTEESLSSLTGVSVPQTIETSSLEDAEPSNNPDLNQNYQEAPQNPSTGIDGSGTKGEESPAASMSPLQLLQDMRSTIHSMVFSPELNSTAQQRSFKGNSMYQERDLDLLAKQVALVVKSKEDGEGIEDHYSASRYIVHQPRVHQLVHVLRALLIPGGHGILFGAARKTGRKTTICLAAYLSGYQLIEVHPGNEANFQEMIKEAGNQTGINGGNVIILVHEEISQVVRDELLLVMGNGTFPGLYSEEDLMNVVRRMNILLKNNRLTEHQILDKYYKNIQRNTHVFFLLPLIEDMKERPIESSAMAAHIIKAVSLCCCVEIYQPWCTQALVESACCRLKDNLQIPDPDDKADKDSLVTSISKAMAKIHHSATKYASALLPNLQLFGPQTYVELMDHFFHFCRHLREQSAGQANRIATILACVKDMTDMAELYGQEVVKLKSKVAETHMCLDQLHEAVGVEHTLCESIRQNCITEENQLSHLEDEYHQAQLQSQDGFNQISPLYQTAVEALQCVSQADVDEVRHYRCPPEGVVMVMDAICMLFNHPRNWESSKQLLGQSNFFQELEFYDRSNLSEDLFQNLAQIVQNPDFHPLRIQGVSRACESLCRWVRALYRFACVERRLAPQEARRRHLEECVAQSRSRLGAVRLREEAARKRLEHLRRRRLSFERDLKELTALLHEAQDQERNSTATVQQLQRHITNWNQAEKEIKTNNQTVSGDSLILAASITYLCPFGSDVRLELLEKWRRLCVSGGIDLNPDDPRTASFTGSESPPVENPLHHPIPVSEEIELILYRVAGELRCEVKEGSPQLIIRLLLWGHRVPWAQRWPLLSDAPQHQELSSQTTSLTGSNCKVRLSEDDYGLVVCADDPELLSKLNQGAEKGLRVLVTHVERAVPCKEFLEVLLRPAGNCSPGLMRPVKAAHPEFCLFLSTPLSIRTLLREIHPLILAEVQVIDLSLSKAEVQDLILNEVVQSECLDLWKQHCRLQRHKQQLQEKLHLEDGSLMDYILQSTIPLLQDPKFLLCVSDCQSVCQGLQSEIAKVARALERQQTQLSVPQGVASLAGDFYQALQEVSQLSPSYRFPLSSFLLSVRASLAPADRPDVGCPGQVAGGTNVTEITQRMALYLLAQYRPSLFQSHAALLRLLVCVAWLARDDGSSEAERQMFLRGVPGAEPPGASPSVAPSDPEAPSWLPLPARALVRVLERTAPFEGLASSLATSPRQWREYLRFPSSTVVGPAPCESHIRLSTMQRAVLWGALRPQWLAAVSEDLAACQQGRSLRSSVAGAPHAGSPESLSRFLLRNEGPVIVSLPGSNGDGWASIQPLHWIKQVSQCQGDKKKVMVISFGSTCQTDILLPALDRAAKNGYWLILNNCHLLDQWDTEVVSQLTQLMPCTTRGLQVDLEDNKEPRLEGDRTGTSMHPHFRLWFITRDHTPLSIPAVVRGCAVRVVCDSPLNLREELHSSLQQAVCVACSTTPSSGPTRTFLEPLLRCAILHAVLMQRQAYANLDQGNRYCWTQEDLLSLMDAHMQITRHCSDPLKALEFIAGDLVYGGHVTDRVDLQVVKAVSTACLRPTPALLSRRGPHNLSDIISLPENCDFDSLLCYLDRRVQATLNGSDSSELGLSAGLAVERVKVESQKLVSLLRRSQSPRGTDGGGSYTWSGFSAPLDNREAQERLQRLRGIMGDKDASKGVAIGTASLCPLRSFLQKEWDDLKETATSLPRVRDRQIRDANAGVCSCANLTASTASELEIRAELVRSYLRDSAFGDQPRTYRLSAFHNPRGLLAALLREAANANQKDVSQMYLHFQVLGASASPSSQPGSGVYLHGLEVQGALWDTRLGALQDTLSPQPCPMPLVWVRARARNAGITRSPDGPPGRASPVLLYQCPLYLEHQLQDTDRGPSEEKVVVHVPLSTNLDPVLCTLRGIRLVSTLTERAVI